MSVSYGDFEEEQQEQILNDTYELEKLESDDCHHYDEDLYEAEDGDFVICTKCDMTIVDRRVGVLSYVS